MDARMWQNALQLIFYGLLAPVNGAQRILSSLEKYDSNPKVSEHLKQHWATDSPERSTWDMRVNFILPFPNYFQARTVTTPKVLVHRVSDVIETTE